MAIRYFLNYKLKALKMNIKFKFQDIFHFPGGIVAGIRVA